ncbi:cytochrome c biogenesis CcdA family protein [Pontivivens insulae]|uniref:Thiol:disulfide interchange protein DsbD n=1 Tax=Pontivivens insulae TaxID=1639689 RepID=A0A2R8AC64_9RHOB|nr:cytochrome c biogenesis protein CcdA [Pontivivens insulae]RED13743.1 cytochrome c biogenesis protein CcdA [Pontivivens insulae]SPF29817.1 Thiol:disulfide interchange protein DsbD [Pontivivens insulae]
MFGLDIMDASLLAALGISLTAGMLSFLSPCVLPIVPPYLAYMAGASMDDLSDTPTPEARRKVVIAALFFVLGLSTVFLIMGAAASSIGRLFLTYQREFAMLAGAVVTIFGLHFLGIFRIGFLYREARIDAGDRGGSSVGAYILGLAFAFGWTPCIGPILGAILSLAAQEASIGRGIALMAIYAAGLGIPFLIAAFFLQRFMGAMVRIRPWMGTIEKVMGVLLIIVGVMMLTGAFTDLSFWLLEQFPALGAIG